MVARHAITYDIDSVCFDCWGTLLIERDTETTWRRRVELLRACASDYGRSTSLEAARVALDAAWSHHWNLWTAGKPSDARSIAHEALSELRVDVPGARSDLVEHLAASVQTDEVEVLPGAHRTLDSLTRAGIRLALVCDTGLTSGTGVRRLLDGKNLLEQFGYLAFSDESGASKPDPRIFRDALSGIGAVPGRTVHVGDLRRTDVAGARALGMRTVRIRWAHDDVDVDHPDADVIVDSHDDLRGLFALS